MILVVGGIKGGSGKTTIATNLAICRVMQDKHVWLIDADDQGSAIDWDSQREIGSPNLLVESIQGKKILTAINDDEAQWYDDIIIDCGGRDTTSLRAALLGCDAFLAPFRPRSMDIWTLSALRKINAEIRAANTKFRVMAVLNQCEPRGMDKKTARTIIEENKIECLGAELGYRKAFSDASSAGLGVIEQKGADLKSIQEILILHDDIYKTDMLHTFKIDGKDIWQSLEK